MNEKLLTTKPAILLVDDRPENLRALQALLADLEVETVCAGSGNEALLLTLKQDFALVLLDVQMPDMDGFETAELMRSNPKTRQLPIIFITAGLKDMNCQFKGYDAGAVDYLTKPVEPLVIRSKVQIFRDLYQQRRELEIHRQHLQALVDQRTAELQKAAQELEQRVIDRTLELQQANQQLETFAYSVSHDLRAPLRHIHSFSRILQEEYAGQLNRQGVDMLQRIVGGCSQMDLLINSILAFSQSARQPLNKLVVNPARMAREVFEKLATPEEQQQIAFSIGQIPECLADPILFYQVLANLISNAIKYSKEQDHPAIEVGYAITDGTPAYFIRDNGIGFDMEFADRLFGVFQRLHSDKKYEGTGVGLAIVHNIIQRHGGRIWAEAEVDKGATFHFSL